jgi:mycothiol system anti-sigma-R factor
MPLVLDCTAVMRQLWDYLDDELTPERMDAIREHLALCRCCQPHEQFERAFLNAVGRARDTAPATGALRERVLAALRSEGFESEIGNRE